MTEISAEDFYRRAAHKIGEMHGVRLFVGTVTPETEHVILGALFLALSPQVLLASDTLSRYLVAVGSNFGGPETRSNK